MSIEETLKDRGSNYGDYGVNVEGVATIMGELQHIHKAKTGEALNLIDYSNLNYLVIKLVRLAATPNHVDSYHDLAGYSTLMEEYYGD